MITPLISIVLPVYNGERFLTSSVESCLAQTFQEWELIVVDDASTDSTHAICLEYANIDSRIRIYQHEINRKLPAALNTGFSHAQGKFFTWTSDDNLYEYNALEEMFNVLQNNSNISVVYADYSIIDENSIRVGSISALNPEYLVLGNAVGPCFLYRRDLHESLKGYDEGLFLVEDYDFWLRASVNYRLEPLRVELYRYRRHGNTLTSAHSISVAQKHVSLLQQKLPSMSWLSTRAKVLGWVNASLRNKSLGKYSKYLSCMVMALATSPVHALQLWCKVMVKGDDCLYKENL